MLCCAAGVLAADSLPTYELLPYYGYIDYHDSATKTRANLLGLYGSVKPGSQSQFEGDVEYIALARPLIGNLHQTDSTLAYSNFSIPHLKLRLGAHYISSTDALTDQGWVAFLGTDYAHLSRWNAGLDAYRSEYPNYAPALHVTQLTPHVGFALSSSETPTLAGELKGYWINTDRNVGFGKVNYYSVEGNLMEHWRQVKLLESAWFGEQDFAVRNDGFIVFNLAERHTGGQRLEAEYAWNDKQMFIARVTREQFQDLGVNDHASSMTYLGMLRFLF
jgi:hypothetical protein